VQFFAKCVSFLKKYLDMGSISVLVDPWKQASEARQVALRRGPRETTTVRGGFKMELYILEVEVLEAKIAPGGGISLGGQ
jgi:hypothetical protein